MNIFKRLAAVAAITTLSVAGIVAVASPAQAAPPASCANSSVCGYADTAFYTNNGYEFIPVRSGGTCERVGLPNQWSSLYNNSGRAIRIYKASNCTGDYATYSNGGSTRVISMSNPGFDNNIESVKFM